MGGEMKSLYFPHDANARFDLKCIELIRRHGYEGYGIYFAILEYLFTQDGYMPDDNSVITAVLPYVITDKITEIKNTLFELNLLQKKDNSVIFSERLCYTIRQQKSIKSKKSEAGKKGMNTRWNRDNSVITELLPPVITPSITIEKKGIEKKGIEIKKKNIKEKIFIKPTMEEICDYLTGHCEVPLKDAELITEKFFNWYESVGWYVGKKKMVNWKAAVSGWLLNKK